MNPEDITEEMVAACVADSAATRRAYRSIILKNIAATMRTSFKIEITDRPEVAEHLLREVLQRLGH